MADDRLWMFNPGCPEAACCDEEEPECEDICVTVKRQSDGALLSGATVDAGPLGSGTTDVNGRICFSDPVPGTRYVFYVTFEPHYHPNAISYDYAEEDCPDVTELEVSLVKKDNETGCVHVEAMHCNCGLPGVTVTISLSTGPVYSAVTDWFGRIKVCIPTIVYNTTFNWTITATIPGHTGSPSSYTGAHHPLFNPIDSGVYEFSFTQDDDSDRFCFRNIPDGISGIHCLEYYPDELTVTFSGLWHNSLAGQVVTLFRTGTTYSSGCLPTPDPTGPWNAYSVSVSISHTGPCGSVPSAIIQVNYRFNGFPACTSSADDMSFQGTSTSEPGGSGGCPVAFYTGFARTDVGDTHPYNTDRTVTVSE